MEALQLAGIALRHPSILRSYRRILLIGHMRANSSLIGHILGSNPEIEGYYEMHMGYHSWRSFYRQKLKYFAEHRPKAGARFIFDKVLHDDHSVNYQLFSGHYLLFTLRTPEVTIPSTVRLYQRVDPRHEHATVEGAADYYLQRAASIARQSADATGGYFYYDADALRDATDQALTGLSDYLGLRTPLSQEYRQQNLTGARRVGDSSKSINSGKVISQRNDYSDITVPDPLLDRARDVYRRSRETLLKSANCRKAVTLDV